METGLNFGNEGFLADKIQEWPQGVQNSRKETGADTRKDGNDFKDVKGPARLCGAGGRLYRSFWLLGRGRQARSLHDKALLWAGVQERGCRRGETSVVGVARSGDPATTRSHNTGDHATTRGRGRKTAPQHGAELSSFLRVFSGILCFVGEMETVRCGAVRRRRAGAAKMNAEHR